MSKNSDDKRHDEREVEREVSTPDVRERAPYEPPRLTRVGNLRELLGKSGARFDNPNPHNRRP